MFNEIATPTISCSDYAFDRKKQFATSKPGHLNSIIIRSSNFPIGNLHF